MSDDEDTKVIQFHEMGLDDRILMAVANLGWAEPTLIQEKAIPLSLQGKDVLARARTGSGKTAAYAIPVIQKILMAKQNAIKQCIRAIVMTPTKELCSQAAKNIQELTSGCSREVICVDISGQVPLDAHRPMLMEQPDIVVGTPSRFLAHLKVGNLNLKQTLEMVVVDEADLVFSFGYEEDLKTLLSYLPNIYQAFLMSATLGDDVRTLKRLLLHNPVTLKLEEPQIPETSQLTQYHIKCQEEDKYVIIYTMFKLGLIRGKTLVFVNTIDRCYKLKLFLEQFAIISCILNSELPINSRVHLVEQFNKGLYNIIIAADEVSLTDPRQIKSQKRKKDKESGIARGIDFQFVSNVVNFDFPLDVDSYIHRVGRTARGKNQGTALSFVNHKEMALLEMVETSLKDAHPEGDTLFKPYNFKMNEIEGFRYRAKDAMRAVTKVAIREARLKEIKSEILASNKLKTYFEDNPRDLQLLRHDKNLHTVKNHQQLKNVPDYLVPETLKHHKLPDKRRGKSSAYPGKKWQMQSHKRREKRKADPLNSFAISEIKKKPKQK